MSIRNRTAAAALVIAALPSCDSQPQPQPEFAVINDDNIEQFVEAHFNDAGSSRSISANIDLTVEGNGLFKMHGNGKPRGIYLNLPEPYEYILVMCGDIQQSSSNSISGRLTNRSPVKFGLFQAEDDPAFKLVIDHCDIQ